MNMLSAPTLSRDVSIASARRETEVEVHIHHELEAAEQFRAATATYRATIANIVSDLGFLPGHDKRSVLDVLDLDFVVPPDAEVERWAEDNVVRSE